VPATFFAVSRLADENPGLADPLRGAGEVGSQTSDNGTLGGLPRGEQETRLRRSVSEIQSWTGVAPQGLRPPEEAADAETLEAWHTLGGSYVVGLNGGRTGSPEVHAVENGEIVLLPRAMKDDYNLIIQERLLRPETFAGELLEGLEKLRSLGGLALLMVHSELAGKERYMESLGTVLDFIVADPNWWAATGGEVAEWTLARRESEIRVTRTNEDRIEIQVRAPANRPLRGGWVELALPEGAAGWAPESEAGPLPYADCDRGIQIAIGDLAPGEVRTIVVIYRPEPAIDSAP
jgi:peptidoglycan/xylan/chitin deacetylase (PgdA/CDA1 family)